jgi:hypothetical protein
MCAFGIDNCASTPPKSCFLGGMVNRTPLALMSPVKSLDIGDSETQFDFPCRIHIGSRVQSECGLARRELAPSRRFEFDLWTERITMEFHGFVHVGDELDYISKLCRLHVTPRSADRRTPEHALDT